MASWSGVPHVSGEVAHQLSPRSRIGQNAAGWWDAKGSRSLLLARNTEHTAAVYSFLGEFARQDVQRESDSTVRPASPAVEAPQVPRQAPFHPIRRLQDGPARKRDIGLLPRVGARFRQTARAEMARTRVKLPLWSPQGGLERLGALRSGLRNPDVLVPARGVSLGPWGQCRCR